MDIILRFKIILSVLYFIKKECEICLNVTCFWYTEKKTNKKQKKKPAKNVSIGIFYIEKI